MSRFRFEIPTEAEAREFLDWRRREGMYQTDLYADTLACQRRLRPVVTESERGRVVDLRPVDRYEDPR